MYKLNKSQKIIWIYVNYVFFWLNILYEMLSNAY